MRVEFADKKLRDLFEYEVVPKGYSKALLESYRNIVQFLMSASSERDIRAMMSFHYEKLAKDKDHQDDNFHSIRLKDQGSTGKRLVLKRLDEDELILMIWSIEDYH
jgi:plasmid maintenance system killer protein